MLVFLTVTYCGLVGTYQLKMEAVMFLQNIGIYLKVQTAILYRRLTLRE